MQTAANAIRQIIASPEYIDDDGLLTDAGLELAERAGLDVGHDAAGNAYLTGAHIPDWVRYRLSSIVTPPSDATVYGPEGEPVRALIREGDDVEVCYVRSNAGPASMGEMTANQVRRLFGVDEDINL